MELFSAWLSRLEQIKNTAQVELSALNSSQLNWKPADKKWSIAQCLDHLIVSNENILLYWINWQRELIP